MTFGCVQADIQIFELAFAGLGDVRRSPGWKFVLEGPTWHGRRVPTWAGLFAA